MFMNKETLDSITLFGMQARTSNKKESSGDSGVIGATMGQYFKFLEDNPQFKECLNLERLFSVYCDYESDFNGEYTYFVGHQVQNEKSDEMKSLLLSD